MRTLIDGYNVMFAAGLMGRKFEPGRVPQGPPAIPQRPGRDARPGRRPHDDRRLRRQRRPRAQSRLGLQHKGITVLFAVDHDSADERIEDLIARHSNPKTLTVVSSDHRIQKAATRKKAKVLSADEFLTRMDSLKDRGRRPGPRPVEIARQRRCPTARGIGLLARRVPRGGRVGGGPRGRPGRPDRSPPTSELARIEREVEEEFRR